MEENITNSASGFKTAVWDDLAQMREERVAGFPATLGTANNGRFFIDTRITRDAGRSNNGGEYSFWTEYWNEAGKAYRLEQCSCDFWQPMDEPEAFDVTPEVFAAVLGLPL